MITGDFLAMSLTTDRVLPSPTPNSWNIGRMTAAGILLGLFLLAFCVAVLAFGQFHLQLALSQLQTLSAVAIVYGCQAAIYAIRDRHRLWGSRPALPLVVSSVADICIISTLALRGIAMAPLPLTTLACELAAAVLFGLILNAVKIPIFSRLHIA